MSKVKQMAWDNAEKEVDNVELVVDKYNIGDHLYYAKEDYDAKMKVSQ